MMRIYHPTCTRNPNMRGIRTNSWNHTPGHGWHARGSNHSWHYTPEHGWRRQDTACLTKARSNEKFPDHCTRAPSTTTQHTRHETNSISPPHHKDIHTSSTTKKKSSRNRRSHPPKLPQEQNKQPTQLPNDLNLTKQTKILTGHTNRRGKKKTIYTNNPLDPAFFTHTNHRPLYSPNLQTPTRHRKTKKSKGPRGPRGGESLQDTTLNLPIGIDVTNKNLNTNSKPISQMESRHRYFIKEFADWIQFNKNDPTRLLKTCPTSHVSCHVDKNFKALSLHTRKWPKPSTTRNSTVSQTNFPKRCNQKERSSHTAVHRMPSTTLADACLLGQDTPIRPRNPYPRGTAKHTRRQNINRNVRIHLRNDRKQTQEDARVIQLIDLHHHNIYYVLLAFDEWHHRTRFMVGYNKQLISRWIQIYQKARSIIIKAKSNDNISAYTHDLMKRILAKEIHHARALADTGTLIPKGSSGYKIFPTPKQAARLDHFCEHLYQLLQNPVSTLRFKHPVLNDYSSFPADLTDDAFADVDDKLDSMAPRHQSRWGEHNIP